MSQQPDARTTPPWTREKLDLHVTQRIREYADVAVEIFEEADCDTEAYLRDGAEHMLWRIVQEAISDAGWQVTHG